MSKSYNNFQYIVIIREVEKKRERFIEFKKSVTKIKIKIIRVTLK